MIVGEFRGHNLPHDLCLLWYFFTAGLQCLENVYKIQTSNDEHACKYAVPMNLLDIFSTQLNEVSE